MTKRLTRQSGIFRTQRISYLGDICGTLSSSSHLLRCFRSGPMISTEELSELLPIPSAPQLSSEAWWFSLHHLTAGGQDSSGANTLTALEHVARV